MTLLQKISVFFLCLSAGLACWNFLRSSTVLGRLIAVDLLSVMGIGVVIVGAFFLRSDLYLDIALVYSALSFTAIIVFSQVIQQTQNTTITEKESIQ
jgi:multicomponent Na+:H+ antiporter subunit F